MIELSKKEQKLVDDILAGKLADKPATMTCLSCKKEFEIDMETSVCEICKKAICHTCEKDLDKLMHHKEQKVRFYDLMTNPQVQKELKLQEENEKLKRELAALKSNKRRKSSKVK